MDTRKPAKDKDYVKVSLNIPDGLFVRIQRVAAVLGAGRTTLVIRALEMAIDTFEKEAEAVQKVRGRERP